jgi:hypothetical protein
MYGREAVSNAIERASIPRSELTPGKTIGALEEVK